MSRKLRIGVFVCGAMLLIGILGSYSGKWRAARPEPAPTDAPRLAFPQVSVASAAMADEAPNEPAPNVTGAKQALARAEKAGKHLFVLAYRTEDEQTAKMKAVFASAKKSLATKAVFYELAVGDEKESSFVREYGLSNAPLPLTLLLAPNGAVVKAYVQRVVDEKTLGSSFASAKLAEVLKLLQQRKIVLLCLQGKQTQHNAESMAAARQCAADQQAGGAIEWVRVDPTDRSSADLLAQLKVDSSLKEATIDILLPPSILGGSVEGATTKDALWKAILKSIPSCGSSCGPSGCG